MSVVTKPKPFSHFGYRRTGIAILLSAMAPAAIADILVDGVNQGATFTTSGNLTGTLAATFLINVDNANGGATSFTVQAGHTLQENNSTTFLIGAGATLGSLVNQGTILGNHFNAINSNASSTVTNFDNSGLIQGQVNGNAGAIFGGAVGTFSNSGTIEHIGSSSALILNNATTITNSGAIQSATGHGLIIGFPGSATVGTFTNSGTITTSGAAGVEAVQFGNGTDAASIGIFSNSSSGVISNSGAGDAIAVSANATITTFSNAGTVTGGVSNAGAITTLDNSSTLGALTNSGSIGTVNNTGTITTLSNTGSIATLSNAQNNLNFNGQLPSNYNVSIASAANYGKLIVTAPSGTTTFGIKSGSTVTGTTYSDVLSGVTAANIANLTGTFGVWRWTLSDNDLDNAWDLSLAGSLAAAAVAQGNGPVSGAAAVIDQSVQLLNLFNGLTTEKQQSDALTQTLPLLTGGSMLATQNALTGVNHVIQARIETNRGLSSGDAFYGDRHAWMKPFGSWSDQDERSGVSGYKAKIYGLVFGVDGTSSDALRLGAAFAYARADVNGRSTVAPQSADVDVYQLIGYGSYSLDARTDINFQADIGQNTNKGRRRVDLVGGVASSSYDSQTAHVGVGIGRVYPLDERTSLTPSVRADYTWIKDKAYREKGAGDLNLTVDSRTTDAFVLSVDGKLAHRLNDRTTLTANLGAGYDTMSERTSITAAFAGAPGAAFVTHGIDPSPWMARAGFGASYQTKNGVEITARYDAEYRVSFLNQTASIKARWAF